MRVIRLNLKEFSKSTFNSILAAHHKPLSSYTKSNDVIHLIITMSSTTTLTETASIPKASPGPTLTVIKNGFGAEITGLDFTNGVTDEAYNYIRNAVTKVGHT